jgi:hypothetical protein
MTSNPEEKRKTIGDVFVKVSLSMCDSLPVGIRLGLNIKLGVEHSCFAGDDCAFLFVDTHTHPSVLSVFCDCLFEI